jgi:hypothetical protein
MSLTPPAERQLAHLRDIELRGYERADGLFDIEAQIRDTKTAAMPNVDRGGWIAPGEAMHDMMLRVTIDEDMTIVACEAAIAQGPFAACPGAAGSFGRLVGLTIKPGFLREAAARVGGTAGCTHLRELLQQVGTTAFQTLWPVRLRRRELARQGGRETAPKLLNSCHAYADTGETVRRRWPHLYRGPGGDAAQRNG